MTLETFTLGVELCDDRRKRMFCGCLVSMRQYCELPRKLLAPGEFQLKLKLRVRPSMLKVSCESAPLLFGQERPVLLQQCCES